MTVPPGIDVTVPNAARMYDYYLGGKDNFAVDRAAADAVLSVAPEMRDAARSGRELIKRVVRHMIIERGIRQIIDIGSGLPTRENVHQIAQEIDPSVRVVYVDRDEVVCRHGQALLSSANTTMVQGDLRDPAAILADPGLRKLIDLDEPAGVLMMFLLHLIPDGDGPHAPVAAIREALAPGSVLAISHAASDARPEHMAKISAIYQRANSPFTPRDPETIRAFFGDWPLEEPGLVHLWPFAELPAGVDPDLAAMGYAAVAVRRR
ncbi:SAM-dependent methyltransferase [Actinoplanes campanulatus]|uniref:SAM-dependent methyltransferase n=1 Tax=Actinoplanes campanulatus TaxID=113559 RepID=A0A7W5AE72_9ACTN|nr:SAM-dependent methyltransferase [Actinoplanes campanulatus]MBB3094678.1 SAM-dependent methyltransferase [Actinoplanes campanulatus]